MSERVRGFQKRRQRQADLARRRHLQPIADQALVAELLQDEGDDNLRLELEAARRAAYDIDASDSTSAEDAAALLMRVRAEFDEGRIEELTVSVRKSVLQSIVGPFGLGAVVARFDQEGGPITTVHNARKGVFANSRDQARFEKTFDREDYEKDFPKMRRTLLKGEEDIVDAYTGAALPKDRRMHLDHVKSAKEIHSDDLLRLSTVPDRRNQIATHADNIVPTDRSLNQSKNDRDLLEWKNAIGKGGVTNGERYGVDDGKAREVYDKAHLHFNLSKAEAVARHYASEVGREGTAAAARLGAQQAFGLLLTELVDALFDEARDIFANGFKGGTPDKTFWATLKERFLRVGARVGGRWKDALKAFFEGGVTGFISTVITALLNRFMTTAKNVMRMIREGGMSLLRAVKLLLNPPEGMALREAAHEASKIVLAGAVVAGGVLLEEAVGTVIPPAVPMAGVVTAVIISMATGLATVLGTHMIDKLDLFGVVADQRQGHVLASLSQRFDNATTSIEECLLAFEPVAVK